MKLTKERVGERFRVRERCGTVVLVALGKDGRSAFADNAPDRVGGSSKDRYEHVPTDTLSRATAESRTEGGA